MKYFVVSDVHGFYTELKAALDKNGFNTNDSNHKLIVCGDLMDRGSEAEKLQDFIVELLNKDKVILVRGNHEDLMMNFLKDFEEYENAAQVIYSHHWRNGTVQTALQLAHLVKDIHNTEEVIGTLTDITERYSADFVRQIKKTLYLKTIIPKTVDFFETSNYIFVHGWIPCTAKPRRHRWEPEEEIKYNPDWRSDTAEAWCAARWLNGMDCAILHNILEPNKQIVCGHWHASFGHANYWRQSTKGDEERKKLNCDGKEFGDGADHSPFYAKGIIAIDACTAHSGQVNCLIIDD